MAACPECGVDEDALTIGDAVNAIRSFPRRYRDATTSLDPDLLTKRPDPTTWSVLEYVVHTREVFEIHAIALPIVLEHPGTAFPPVDVDDASSMRPDWVMDLGLALDGLGTACERIVTIADATSAEAWTRPFTVGDAAHVAGWIPRHLAHEGAHHLRDVTSVAARVSRT